MAISKLSCSVAEMNVAMALGTLVRIVFGFLQMHLAPVKALRGVGVDTGVGGVVGVELRVIAGSQIMSLSSLSSQQVVHGALLNGCS